MNTITLQDLRSRGAKAIPDGRVVYLIVNSKTKAVLVPPEEYEILIEALEDLEDIKICEERKGEPTLTWEQMFPKGK